MKRARGRGGRLSSAGRSATPFRQALAGVALQRVSAKVEMEGVAVVAAVVPLFVMVVVVHQL